MLAYITLRTLFCEMIFIAFGSTLLIGDTGHDVIQKCRATTDARNES